MQQQQYDEEAKQEEHMMVAAAMAANRGLPPPVIITSRSSTPLSVNSVDSKPAMLKGQVMQMDKIETPESMATINIARRKSSLLVLPYSSNELMGIVVDLASRFPELYNALYARAGDDSAFRKLFVHGLTPETVENDIRQVFEQYGGIESIEMVMDRATHNTTNKGYAFVTYEDIDSAHNALEVPQKRIGRKTIMCKLAESQHGFAGEASHFPPSGTSVSTMSSFSESNRSLPAGASGANGDAAATAAWMEEENDTTPLSSPNSRSATREQGGSGGNNVPFHQRKIFVRGIPPDTNEPSLTQFFSQFGEVEFTKVAMDPNAGANRGYAFVTFADAEFAVKAIAVPRKEFMGRAITVSRSRSFYQSRGPQSSPATSPIGMRSGIVPSSIGGQQFLPPTAAAMLRNGNPAMAIPNAGYPQHVRGQQAMYLNPAAMNHAAAGGPWGYVMATGQQGGGVAQHSQVGQHGADNTHGGDDQTDHRHMQYPVGYWPYAYPTSTNGRGGAPGAQMYAYPTYYQMVPTSAMTQAGGQQAYDSRQEQPQPVVQSQSGL